MMIRLNEGKNCIGTGTFGELINDRTVKMKKSKDIKSKSSAALSSVTQCYEFRKKYICCERRREATEVVNTETDWDNPIALL